jgi:hypothetical protein
VCTDPIRQPVVDHSHDAQRQPLPTLPQQWTLKRGDNFWVKAEKGKNGLCGTEAAPNLQVHVPFCPHFLLLLVVYGPRCRGGTTAPPIKMTAQGKDLLEDGNPNVMAPPSER